MLLHHFADGMGNAQQSGLVRAIGRWTLAGLMLNSIIGSGIFGLPSVVAGFLGKASPWAYLVTAAGVGLVMGCFAEVASRFREAGGIYLYAREAFGRFAGIQMAWISWLVRVTAAAANANLFVIYLAGFWPAVALPIPRLLVLSLLIGVLAYVNYRGVRAGARMSNVFIVSKLVPLSLFALMGLLLLRANPVAAPTFESPGGWLDAVLVLVFAYGGFEGALFPMSEAKDPQRDTPFALFVALAVTAALYTSIQVVVLGALPSPETAQRPLAAAAAQWLGPAGAALMSVAALVSVYGYLSAQILNAPRLTYALAERKDFPQAFATVHPRFRTPHISVVAFALLVWSLAAAGSFKWNVTLSAVARLSTFVLTCAAVPVLRRKHPGGAAFRIPGGLLIPGLGIAFSLVLVTRMGWGELIIVGVTAACASLNWLWVRRA
jgi:amino acid transporter